MNKELWVKCKHGLITTSFDGEGTVFHLDTRKYYMTNETAAFLLELLKDKHEGLALSSIKNMLLEVYQINDEKRLDDGLVSFFHDLEQHGLGLLQFGNGGKGDISVRNSGVKTKRDYINPKIESELDTMLVGRQLVDLMTDISTASLAQGVAEIAE